MAAMAKGFIDMESLEGTIRKYLVDHEEELEQWLQSPEVQDRFGALSGSRQRNSCRNPLSIF